MTIVGRSQIDHPALGTAGGSALHASIETIYTNVGDDLSARYDTAASIANSAVTTFTHNFGVPFADLKVLLYTGTHPNLVRVSDPTASGWTIAATVGFEKTQIDVTAPSSGGPHTFAVITVQSRGAEKLADLDDINTATPIDGQFLIYDTATSKWIANYLKYKTESATISSNTLTPATGANVQRITSGAADLQMVASPINGKVYVVTNETGSSIQIKNDTGATAANRIYTGTGADFTLKNQASVTLIYITGLSRWVLAGGGGGGGLAPLPAAATISPAVAGTHYLTNTSGGAFTATLPAGLAGSVIMFSDANETWHTFQLTIAPATGEKIDNLATNETLVCDVQRGWVELSWNSVLASWSLRSLAATDFTFASLTNAGIVSTGTQTFAGAKTFVGAVTPSAGIVGKTDGAAVTAGNVGQVLEQTRLRSAGTSLTTGVAANVTATALTLTAGEWDITGIAGFNGSGTTTVASAVATISTTSATVGGGDTYGINSTVFEHGNVTSVGSINLRLPIFRVSISSSTIYYLAVVAGFSGSTLTAYGNIRATRIA